MKIIYGDLCEAKCDAIVNASNGIGFMGGKLGIYKRLAGVAESIHYATQGKVEQAAKQICRSHAFFGFKPGNVFVTPSFNLPCKYIIHAVTMRFPGTFSNLGTVKKLLPQILQQAQSLDLHSIAIPLLGTGTGSLSKEKVLAVYEEFFSSIDSIDICVYIYGK